MSGLGIFWLAMSVLWGIAAFCEWRACLFCARYCNISVSQAAPSAAIYWTVVSLAALIIATAA